MTSVMCQAWAHIFPFLDEDGVGKQIKQDNAKGSWLPCSVFCQTKTGTWYSPRKELGEIILNLLKYYNNQLNFSDAYYLSAALPDGTLCYENENEKYFCQDTLCLPLQGGKETAR